MAKMQRPEIYVELPDDFSDRIYRAIDEEFPVAIRAWGVSISEDQREDVTVYAIEQLKEKMSVIFYYDWNFTQRIHIRVRKDGGLIGARAIPYPTDNENDNAITYHIKGDGVRVESEMLPENLVKGEELPSVLMEKIEGWIRTAVYYGVGSYSGVRW